MPLTPDDVTFDDVEEDISDDNEEESSSTNENVETTEENKGGGEEEEKEEIVEEPDEPLGDFSDEDVNQAFDDYDEEEESDDDEDKSSPENEEKENTNEEKTEEGEDEAEDVRVVDQIASQFGLDPEEDFDEELDDTFDDVIKTAKKGAESMAQKEMNNFFEKYPDIEQYTRYRVNGGDPDKYREEVLNSPTYDDLELEGNESTQERVVREKLQEVDGFSDDKIDDKIERYKSGGYLKSEAEDAREIMSSKQEEKRQKLIEQQEKEAEKRREQQIEEQKKYKQTIHESNDLAGLQLPENQKDDFESYLFEPVDEDGMTQAEKDYQNMGREEALALYYLTYNGLDNLGELVDNKASTKKAEQISNKLKKSSSRSVKDRSEKTRSNDSNPSLEGFDLDQQIG